MLLPSIYPNNTVLKTFYILPNTTLLLSNNSCNSYCILPNTILPLSNNSCN